VDKFNALPVGRKLVLGASFLLLIDTFLPWQAVGPFSWNAWHGFWGVILSLLTIVLVVWTAARAFGVAIPIELPDGLTTLGISAVILLFAIIKNLNDAASAWGSYVGIVVAAVVAYGAWLVFQDSGETLPRMATASTTTAATTAGTTAGTTPTPPPATSPPPADEDAGAS
jgi:hypothetical protein